MVSMAAQTKPRKRHEHSQKSPGRQQPPERRAHGRTQPWHSALEREDQTSRNASSKRVLTGALRRIQVLFPPPPPPAPEPGLPSFINWQCGLVSHEIKTIMKE